RHCERAAVRPPAVDRRSSGPRACGNGFNGEAGKSLLFKQLVCSFEDGNLYFIALRSSPAARLHLRRAHSLSPLHSSHAHNFIAPPLDWRAYIHKTTLCCFILGSRTFCVRENRIVLSESPTRVVGRDMTDVITSEQVAFFKREGYLSPIRAFSPQ